LLIVKGGHKPAEYPVKVALGVEKVTHLLGGQVLFVQER